MLSMLFPYNQEIARTFFCVFVFLVVFVYAVDAADAGIDGVDAVIHVDSMAGAGVGIFWTTLPLHLLQRLVDEMVDKGWIAKIKHTFFIPHWRSRTSRGLPCRYASSESS